MIEVRTTAAPVETVTPRPKTPQEVGEHAARYIEEHGWARRSYRTPDDRVCIVEALFAAGMSRGPSDPDSAYNRLRYGVLDGETPSGWNDAPERTLPEVLAALRSIR